MTDLDTDCERCRERPRTHREQVDRLRGLFPDLRTVEVPEVGPDATGRESLSELAPLLDAG